MGCLCSKPPPPDIDPYIALEEGGKSKTQGTFINAEFNQLKQYQVTHSATVGRKPKNLPKNRYSDILPFDYNRVKLQNDTYINASHIEPNFIATQDPLLTEDSVFWLMVWENNVRTIIRLSTDVDGSTAEDDQQTRCAVYIPTKKWVTDDHIELSIKSTNAEDTFTETIVSMKKEGRQADVKHYHVHGWGSTHFPAPQSTLETLQVLQKKNKNTDRTIKSKILVHCGAGTGRTGTFIALWQLTEAWDRGQKKNILPMCKRLRDQRVGMISRETQYNYLYQCWKARSKTGRVNHGMD